MSTRAEENEHAEDIEDMVAEIKRMQETVRIAGINIVSLNDQNRKLTDALNTACQLIDHLVADLHVHGVMPSVALRFAHETFRTAMNKLLGDPIFSKIDIKLPDKKPPQN